MGLALRSLIHRDALVSACPPPPGVSRCPAHSTSSSILKSSSVPKHFVMRRLIHGRAATASEPGPELGARSSGLQPLAPPPVSAWPLRPPSPWHMVGVCAGLCLGLPWGPVGCCLSSVAASMAQPEDQAAGATQLPRAAGSDATGPGPCGC